MSAVIDFWGLGVGDPACDISAARMRVGSGGRARQVPYYRDTNPVWANIARGTIDDVLADQG